MASCVRLDVVAFANFSSPLLLRSFILFSTLSQELKIKAGAEKLREVATDRKSLSDVATIVKKANSKLNELQAELQQLESQIILTQGQPQSPQQNHSNGQGKAKPRMAQISSSCSPRVALTEREINGRLAFKRLLCDVANGALR